jgi:hypothetical protein
MVNGMVSFFSAAAVDCLCAELPIVNRISDFYAFLWREVSGVDRSGFLLNHHCSSKVTPFFTLLVLGYKKNKICIYYLSPGVRRVLSDYFRGNS